MVFTGHEFADGGPEILKTLQSENIRASFFFTGDFFRNPSFQPLLKQIVKNGHYLGPHSDKHLLYCSWKNRDSLLVSKEIFQKDLKQNLSILKNRSGLSTRIPYFLPPFEWYNDSISAWTKEMGLTLVNYTPGTLSHADYTTPEEKNYRDTKTIFQSILTRESMYPNGLNGFILLMHAGTDSRRTDKFYHRLIELIRWLKEKNYEPVRIDELLEPGFHR